MKFLENVVDPKSEDAYYHLPVRIDTPRADAWRSHLAYLASKTIGRPQATSTYTVTELEMMGYVGIYEVEGES